MVPHPMASSYNGVKQQPWAYVPFDPATGWPVGPLLYYECDRCHDVVPSAPPSSMACTCGNVFVDVSAGRCGANDRRRVRLFTVRA